MSYGEFRNFLILLPAANLERDPSTAWFEAATIVPFGEHARLGPSHARSLQGFAHCTSALPGRLFKAGA